MSPRRLPFSGTRPARSSRGIAVTTAAAALALSGLVAAPAQSAPDPHDCPAAFPVDAVVPDMAVNGLTVTHGITPEPFTGTTLGVLHDGVGPGLDMILVRLSSPEIDKAGIWEGMSGSPVYAPDGRLLGAVAYTLASGTTPVAGVTPAAAMQKLLTPEGTGSTASTAARSVPLPTGMARRLVASGSASAAEAGSGLAPLPVPLHISGLAAPRVRQLSRAWGLHGVDSTGTGTSDEVVPIVPGGNVAASISYGDVTTAGLGTVTAVCGSQVLAFGHPMNSTGTARMTMHGARAIYVQEAPDASFKVANIGAPVGTVDGDHRAGLHGVLGPAPHRTVVTSHVSVGDSSRNGTTWISDPGAVPEIAVAHVVADQDAVLDGMGGGSGSFVWRIRMHTQDGTTLLLRRADAFASPRDISYGTVQTLADTLATLQASNLGVSIDAVTTRSALSHQVARYTLDRVQLWRDGAWHRMDAYGTTVLRPGHHAYLRVLLSSAQLGRLVVRTHVRVPRAMAGRTGTLQVLGGDSLAGPTATSGTAADPFPVTAGSGSGRRVGSVAELARRLRRTPRHDAVLAQLLWAPAPGKPVRRAAGRAVTGQVVDGGLSFQVTGGR